MLYLPFISQQKPFNQQYINNNMERFSFKSGHVTGHADHQAYKNRRLIELQYEFRLNTTLQYFWKALSLKYLSTEWVKTTK